MYLDAIDYLDDSVQTSVTIKKRRKRKKEKTRVIHKMSFPFTVMRPLCCHAPVVMVVVVVVAARGSM